MTSPSNRSVIHAFSHTSTSDKAIELVTRADLSGKTLLDVGAGEGYFVDRLGRWMSDRNLGDPARCLSACDMFPAAFKPKFIPCDPIDIDAGRLPYEENRFDLVTCIEVIEHVENQFHLVRELYRVLKPGGCAVVTTPNLLNINSRMRYMTWGFWLLFEPLSLTSHNPVDTSGHIHPVTFYYVAYMLHRAGFKNVRVHFDRHKRSALLLSIPLYPPIKLFELIHRARFSAKRPKVAQENSHLIPHFDSLGMLTARTVVLEAVK